jgi:hypothetical protein
MAVYYDVREKGVFEELQSATFLQTINRHHIMCLAVSGEGLLPCTISLLRHHLRVETGMKHWVLPLALAEIKNKTAPPPLPPGC